MHRFFLDIVLDKLIITIAEMRERETADPLICFESVHGPTQFSSQLPHSSYCGGKYSDSILILSPESDRETTITPSLTPARRKLEN